MTVDSPVRLQHRLIEADAGTGKTYTLTVHYLRLLLAGADPKRILATTFTRKAAGEILERILLRVADAALDTEVAEVLDRDLGEIVGTEAARTAGKQRYGEWLNTLVQVLPQLSVGTLDAFFLKLVTGFRYELGLVRMNRIGALNDPLMKDLRDRALAKTLDQLVAGEEPLSNLTMRLYRGQAQRSVAWAMDRVLIELHQVFQESRDESLWSKIEVPSGRLSESVLEEAVSAFRSLWQEEALANRKALNLRLDKRVVKALETSDKFVREERWKELLSQGLGKAVDLALIGNEDSCLYYKKPVPEGLFQAYVPIVQHARASLLAELQAQGVATHTLLEVFDQEFRRLRKREGVVLFSDLAELIAHELPARGLDTELSLAYRLDGRVEHALLDEFQDTSTVQWNALRLLVDEVLAWGDGTRTLFCVGDPKQSIYGWRGGRPELFDVVRGQLQEMVESGAASVEPLNRSFRSSPIVLDALNRVFSSVATNPGLKGSTEDNKAKLEAAKRWAEGFEAHRPASHLENSPGYVVLRTSLSSEGMFDADALDDDDTDFEDQDLEQQPLGHLDFAAEQVAAIQRRRPGATVGVLTRSNRVVSETLFALRRKNVDASGEGHGRIVDDPVVTCVISALRLASAPTDTASLFHLAGTPLGKLLEIPAEFSKSPHEKEILLAESRRVSRRIRGLVSRSGVLATVAEWARQLGDTLPTRSKARLQQLMEVVIDQAESLNRDPGELVRLLAEVTVEEPSPALVRVMTVHQAKGLQFDVVVLCELETMLGALYSPLVEVLRDEPMQPLGEPLAVFRASNEPTRRSDASLKLAHAQELQRRMRDDLSSVYVALTRAKSELHLLVQPLEKRKGTRAIVENFTAAGFLRGAFQERKGAGKEGASLDELKRLPNTILYERGEPLKELQDALPDVAPSVVDTTTLGSERENPTLEAGSEPENDLKEAEEAPTPDNQEPEGVRAEVVNPSRAGKRRHLGLRLEDLLQPRNSGALRGQLMHAYLAEVAWLREGKEPVSRSRLEQINRELAPGVSDQWLTTVGNDFRSIILSTEVVELFTRPIGVRVRCWREWPFLMSGDPKANLRLIRGTVDRVVIAEDSSGEVVGAELVDFKTGRRREAEEHHPQLALYRRAVARVSGLLEDSIQVRIAWLDAGSVETVN